MSDHINARTGRHFLCPIASSPAPSPIRSQPMPHSSARTSASGMYNGLAKTKCLAFHPVSRILTIDCCHAPCIRQTVRVLSLVSSGDRSVVRRPQQRKFRFCVLSKAVDVVRGANLIHQSKHREPHPRAVPPVCCAICGPFPCRHRSKRPTSYKFLFAVRQLAATCRVCLIHARVGVCGFVFRESGLRAEYEIAARRHVNVEDEVPPSKLLRFSLSKQAMSPKSPAKSLRSDRLTRVGRCTVLAISLHPRPFTQQEPKSLQVFLCSLSFVRFNLM